MNQFQAWYRALPRALRTLLTINVVLYVLWVVLLAHIEVTSWFVWRHVALNAALPGILFEPWQLVTYNFLHLGTGFWGLIHILFNMLWLYWIGYEYEQMHGPHDITALYLITGVGGGLVTVFLHALFPGVPVFGGVVYGASASVLGVMTGVAIRYPYKKIALIFIGTIRLIYVVVAFLVLDLLFLAGSNTAVGAHLGGALFGFLFVRVEDRGIDLTSWARIFFRDRRSRRSPRRTSGQGGRGWMDRLEGWLSARREQRRTGTKHPNSGVRQRRDDEPAEREEPSIDQEVDRILDKISEHGYDALTAEEKHILYEASRR